MRHSYAAQFASIASQQRWDEPRTLTKTFPYPSDGDPANKSSVTITWLLNEVRSEYDILIAEIVSEVLIGNSGCPLYKAILDSPLGQDLSSPSGVESDLKQALFSVGMRGTDGKHADAIRTLIYDTLRDVVARGVDPLLVEGTLFKTEFSVREIGSLQGLRVMRRAMPGWLYNSDPLSTISVERGLGAFKVRSTRSERLIEEFIQRHLLDNPHNLTLTVNPDSEQADRERAALRARLEKRARHMSAADKKEIVAANERMTRLQSIAEDARALSLIPRLKIGDMPGKVRIIERSVRGDDIPIVHVPQRTNDIAYVNCAIDISNLSPQELSYIPFLTTAITEMGTESHDYSQLSQLINRHFGGLYASSELHTDMDDSRHIRLSLMIRVKTLFRELPQALSLLTELLCETDFSTRKRYNQILTEDVNEMKSAVIPSAHIFSGHSATAQVNVIGAIQERWSGISQLKFLTAINSDSHRRALHSIYQKVMVGGIGVAAVSASQQRLESLHDAVDALNGALRSRFGQQTAGTTDTATGSGNDAPVMEIAPTSYTIPSGGNYVACAVPATRLTKDTVDQYVAESVLARTLTTGVLWEQIRMQGGAYGAIASVGMTPGALCLVSYRDPHVARTLTEFRRALDYAAQGKLTKAEIGQTIVAITGTENTPLPPGRKIGAAFMRHISNYDDQLRQRVYRSYLKCPLSQVTAAAQRLHHALESQSVAVIGEPATIQEAQKQHPDTIPPAEPLML